MNAPLRSTQSTPKQELTRLLDETANFELAHALRLYCQAHAADGRLSHVLKELMLQSSDASMRRVDLLSQRLIELTGRVALPHVQVAPTPERIDVDSLAYGELSASMAAVERYATLCARAAADAETQALFELLREEHVRESAHFAHLLDAVRIKPALPLQRLD